MVETIDLDAFRNFEKAGFDKVAGPYHEFLTPVSSQVVGALLQAAEVRPGTRLLDVATGPGDLVARALERGAASAVGVDLAPGMVALARRLHPNLDFREADAEGLPFGDGSFDAVVSNFGIGHLPNPERAVTEFARVLARGGTVALSWWDVPERSRFHGLFLDAMKEAAASPDPELPSGPPLFRFSVDDEFSRLLRDRGLREVAVRTISFKFRWAGPDELWDGMLRSSFRVGRVILKQVPATQKRIRIEFDRLIKECLVERGVEVPMSVKVASGRKPLRRVRRV